MSKKTTYTITLGGFSALEGDNPLDATKRFVKFLKNINLNELVYSVKDENTGVTYTVDLLEDDEDAVLIEGDNNG